MQLRRRRWQRAALYRQFRRSQAAASDVSGFARIPDITRKLNQQSTAEGVLNTTATEIGTQWKVGRCMVALRKPGSSASAWKEFVAAGNPAAVGVLQPLVCGLHDLAMEKGPLVYADIASAPELQPFTVTTFVAGRALVAGDAA